MAVRKVGMPLADLARGGNEYSRSGVCPRAGENNYPELPISADTLKLIYFFKSVPLYVFHQIERCQLDICMYDVRWLWSHFESMPGMGSPTVKR